jgi:hypothetical protein
MQDGKATSETNRETRTIRGRRYVIGDRYQDGPQPALTRPMQCGNGCGFAAIFDSKEIALIMTEGVTPLCMHCAIELTKLDGDEVSGIV